VDRDKKPGHSGTTPLADSEEPTPKIGPHNPALGEIYQRLYPEIKRPKPNQEAIAAALKAMQQLTMQADSEIAVEETTAREVASKPCESCGHLNREGNKFCGMCGLPVEGVSQGSSAAPARTVPPVVEPAAPGVENLPLGENAAPMIPVEGQPQASPTGTHHYHHHYHYFPGGGPAGNELPASSGRAAAPESAREADRMRIVAAAKGEPMSRGEAAVRRLTQEWVLACNMRQLDELLDLYAPDALVLRSNTPLLRGAAAIREFFFSALESGLGEVAVEPIRVEIIGDLAHEVGRYSALVPGTTGKRREERGKYLWVFAKQGGGEWKLISECWSTDLTLTNAESDIPKAPQAQAKGVLRK
jgi:uncharacterized protein (TIGR02246 family)